MKMSHDIKNIRLTASEVGDLFNTYLFNSASKQMLSYFTNTLQDPDIKSVIQFALDLSNKIVGQVEAIFKSINHPIPKGFSEADVNAHAEKLFEDHFILTFTRFMARLGLTNYSEARCACTRSDVTNFFNETIKSTMKLYDMSDEVLLKKGLYIKAPYIPIPDNIDIVEKQSFLRGFFGEKRTLNATEISRLYLAFERNSLYKAFLIGLCQTSRNNEIIEYLVRGKKICEKHIEIMGSILKEDSLPVPMTLDSEITNSKEPVFSDKLSLFFVIGLFELAIAVNGITLSRVMKRDLSLTIGRIIAEIGQYAEDGVNMMISNRWLERIPQASDRKELIEV